MYNALKTDLATFLGISKDALHIHIGLALFLGLVLLLRRSPPSPLPWLIVLGFELANELMDIFHWHAGAWSFELGDSGKDLISTMLWPTVILLFARLRLWTRGPVNGPEAKVHASNSSPVAVADE
jgi:hypothetical protein